jgi:hypothetical protein
MSSTRSTDSFRAIVNGIGALVVVVGVVFIVMSYRHPTIGTLFLALGWVSIVAFYFFAVQSARALFKGDDVLALGTAAELHRGDLQREKKALLKAIKEVEFDKAMRKLDEGDAEAQIAIYRARALEVIAELGAEAPREYVDVVEKELKRRLEKATVAPGTCPACTTKNDADAEFCKKCGKPLGGKA